MPFTNLIAKWSLKTRLSLGVALVVLATAFSIATIALQLVKANIETFVADDEVQRLLAIADAVDLKFASRMTLLKTLANSLEALPDLPVSNLQRYLERLPSLRESFDNVAIIDLAGNLVANQNGALPSGTLNIADRDYFKQTVANQAGIVSQPYRNRVTGLAQVAVTAAVSDDKGAVRFVISGLINLRDRKFFGELDDVKFGSTGFLFIMTKDGVIVDLPDKSRILSHVNADGRNDAITRALEGFEGTTQGVTSADVPGVYAFKQTREANWILGAFYPRAEAFAQVYRIERQAWTGAVVLSLLSGLVAFMVIRHQLRPLTALHDRMLAPGSGPSHDPPTSYRDDELGAIARAFDDLVKRQLETELQVRTIIDSIPALVSHVDAGLRYTYVNANIRKLYASDALVGQAMEKVRGFDDFSQVKPYFERALAGETVEVERRGDASRPTADRTYQAHYIPDRGPNGQIRGVFSMSFDVTEQVQIRRELASQEKMLRDITDGIPALVAYFDLEQRCLFGNTAAREFSGVGAGPLEGVTLRSSLGEALNGQVQPFLREVLSGSTARFPVHAMYGGIERHFQVHLVPDKDVEGTTRAFYAMAFDTTALRTALSQQEKSEKFLRTITDNLPALISYIDRDQKISFANATYSHWLEQEATNVIGHSLRDALGAEHYSQREPMIRLALAGERVEFESDVRSHGHERATHTTFVPDKDPSGEVRGVFALTLDITEAKMLERQLKQLARKDPLTGLPNRLALAEILVMGIARAQRGGAAMAVMFLDIDRFKSINDTFGHAAGDAILIGFAKRLKASVRATDTVGRLGGDEFVVILENLTTREMAALVAQKIIDQVSSPAFEMQDSSRDVTTSIGIAYHEPGATVTSDELLSKADAALYEAKAAGRNIFRFWVDAATA